MYLPVTRGVISQMNFKLCGTNIWRYLLQTDTAVVEVAAALLVFKERPQYRLPMDAINVDGIAAICTTDLPTPPGI